MNPMKFDGQKQSDLPFALKEFGQDNKIPGVSGALNTPPASTTTGWTNYMPPGMAPNTNNPPADSQGAIIENKMGSVIDSGDNFSPFNFPFNMNPTGNAGDRKGAIDDCKQGESFPLGKPFNY